MKFAKIFQYSYLIFSILFLSNAVTKYINDETIAYPSILLSGLALFMFFFKQKLRKKYENKNKSN